MAQTYERMNFKVLNELSVDKPMLVFLIFDKVTVFFLCYLFTHAHSLSKFRPIHSRVKIPVFYIKSVIFRLNLSLVCYVPISSEQSFDVFVNWISSLFIMMYIIPFLLDLCDALSNFPMFTGSLEKKRQALAQILFVEAMHSNLININFVNLQAFSVP